MTERIHNVDGNIVELEKHSMDKWAVFLNGRDIMVGFGGVKKGQSRFSALVKALKSQGFEYEEFVQDRVETDAMPESESAERFVLSRVTSDGDVNDMNYSEDKAELQEILRESEL